MSKLIEFKMSSKTMTGEPIELRAYWDKDEICISIEVGDPEKEGHVFEYMDLTQVDAQALGEFLVYISKLDIRPGL